MFGILDEPVVVVSVLNEIFDEGKFDKQFVEWMESSPRGPNVWYAARDDGRPVGIYGMLPLTVTVDGHRHNGCLCNNVGTVPDYRGKGIFASLGWHAVRAAKVDIVVGVPNEAAVPGHLKVGWKRVGKLELLRGETTASGEKTRALDHRTFLYFPPFRQARVNGEPLFAVARSDRAMEWRYSKPGQEYRQSVFPDGRMTVWKVWEERKQILETNDWEVIPNLGGIVDVWQVKGSKVSSYLRGVGFESVMERDLMVHTELDVTTDPDRIRFEACDFDTF